MLSDVIQMWDRGIINNTEVNTERYILFPFSAYDLLSNGTIAGTIADHLFTERIHFE